MARGPPRGLTPDEHFSVDGTMLQAWASHKSFKRKDGGSDDPRGGGRERDFRGEKRSNDTHQSTTDPEARLYRKAHNAESKLSYLVHVVIENPSGWCDGLDGDTRNWARRARGGSGAHKQRAATGARDVGCRSGVRPDFSSPPCVSKG
jgi:hypothetical protein